MKLAVTNLIATTIDQPTPEAPPGFGEKVSMITNWVMWGGIAMFSIAMILAFIMVMMANSDRGEGFTRHLGKVGIVILGGIGLTAIGGIGTAIFG